MESVNDKNSLYNDEQILSVNEYENIAKAYSNALKSKGFIIVQVDNEKNDVLIKEIFENLYFIKTLLFNLGGFMGTSKFYSLNERQIKKLAIILDFEENVEIKKSPRDKTKCLLEFLSTECLLIKNLIELADKTSYESQIKDIINSRLNLLSSLLEVN